jgi:hypothetical protein
MQATELRDEIKDLLTAEIGTYALTGGATTPAIIILSAGDVVSDRTVTGLEVVIRRTPISDQSRPTFDAVRAEKNWQVFLVQWAGAYTLDAAQDKLRRHFANSRSIPIKIEKGSGIKEQVSVRIPDLEEFDQVT